MKGLAYRIKYSPLIESKRGNGVPMAVSDRLKTTIPPSLCRVNLQYEVYRTDYSNYAA